MRLRRKGSFRGLLIPTSSTNGTYLADSINVAVGSLCEVGILSQTGRWPERQKTDVANFS